MDLTNPGVGLTRLVNEKPALFGKEACVRYEPNKSIQEPSKIRRNQRPEITYTEFFLYPCSNTFIVIESLRLNPMARSAF